MRNKAELPDCFLQANLALSTFTSSCSVHHFVKTIANLSTVMLLLLQIQEVVVIAEPGAILYTSTKKKKKGKKRKRKSNPMKLIIWKHRKFHINT